MLARRVPLFLLSWLAASAAGQPLVDTRVKDINTVPLTPLSSNPNPLATPGPITLFTATTESGAELWRSDGTAAGTSLVADIVPGANGSSPANAVVLPSGDVLFSAFTEATGRELWRTDGTPGGTAFVRDIEPGVTGSSIDTPVLFQGDAWFTATTSAHGTEIWRSDGTTAGTQLAVDTQPGTPSAHPAVLTPGVALLYFRTGVEGSQLIATDGSPGGAKILFHAADFVCVSTIAVLQGVALFDGCGANGARQLWRSDGTIAGTFVVDPGVAPERFYIAGSRAFFHGTDAAGTELWVTDGTPGGTTRVVDTQAGSRVGRHGRRGRAARGWTGLPRR